MGYKLIESKKSKIQLEELVRYLLFKIESSQAAEHLLKEVKEVYQRLEENPEQFPCCQDDYLRKKKYRKAVLSTMNYTVIFKVVESQVYVMGIFHDSENYSDKL